MKYSFLKLRFMSGTGNSYRTSVWMKDAALKKGIDYELEQIPGHHVRRLPNKKSGTLMGFVFPTYGFTAPWAVIRHTLLLPWGRGRPAFVVATKGALMLDSSPIRGFEGSAAYLIALILLIKGYRVRGVMGLDMPANMINVHSGLTEADARVIEAQAKEKSDSFINRILDGRKAYWSIMDMLLGVALLPMSCIYLLFVRFFQTKLFFSSLDCTGCGLCARHCPKHAIIMVGRKKPRPYWKLNCENCMRCMSYCPKKAIEASHLLAVFLLVLITIPVHPYLLNLMSGTVRLVMEYPFITVILRYLSFLVKISLAYGVFFCLMWIPPVNRFFSHMTLTHFYRRYHEPDTELREIFEAGQEKK